MTDRPVLEAVGEVQHSRAPWTDEQVAALNAHQKRGDRHPFTCPGDDPGCRNRRELIATNDGWVCQCGEYRQGWAHPMMFSPTPIVNQPFERVPTHAGDPGFGPIPPETNVVHVDRDTPATPIVNAGEER